MCSLWEPSAQGCQKLTKGTGSWHGMWREREALHESNLKILHRELPRASQGKMLYAGRVWGPALLPKMRCLNKGCRWALLSTWAPQLPTPEWDLYKGGPRCSNRKNHCLCTILEEHLVCDKKKNKGICPWEGIFPALPWEVEGNQGNLYQLEACEVFSSRWVGMF